MARKTVCDICGKDALEFDFVMPMFKPYVVEGGGVKLYEFEKIEDEPINLCPECRVRVAKMMRLLKGTL